MQQRRRTFSNASLHHLKIEVKLSIDKTLITSFVYTGWGKKTSHISLFEKNSIIHQLP